MSKYAVIFFPKGNTESIQNFRIHYDPKSELILPHITLVFPFPVPPNEGALFDEIKNTLKKHKPFEIELKGHHLDQEDNFLHLLVGKGKEEIIAMHDDLYSGMLESYWRKDLAYVPHMTIGVFANPAGNLDADKYKQALENLRTNELRTTFHFDGVSVMKIEDPKAPRTWVKTFDL